MPSGKPRSKEQTWNEEELKSSLKDINDERRSKERRSQRHDGEDKQKRDERERRHKSDVNESGSSNRSRDDRTHASSRKTHEDKERYDEKKDNDRQHRNRENNHNRGDGRRPRDEKDKDRERHYRDDDGRERRHKDGKDQERRRRDDKDDERRHRDDRDGERRHRDDRDGERRHRDDRDGERRHREDRDGEKRHRDSERRHREDKDGERRHRDGEKRHRDGERRHRDERNGERQHRDERDGERQHKDEKENRDRWHRSDRDSERQHRDDKGRKKRHENRDHDRHKDSERNDQNEKGQEKHHRNEKDRGMRHQDDQDSERQHRDDRDSERRRRDKKDSERQHRDDRNDERQHWDDRDSERRRRDKKDSERQHRDDRNDEKRHKDDRDSERPHRDDRTSDKKFGEQELSSRQRGDSDHRESKVHKEDSKEKKDVTADDEYGDYEEDFEDYDDDFEDDDADDTLADGQATKMDNVEKKKTNSEMEELFDALNRENDRLLAESRKSNWSDSTDHSEEKQQREKKTIVSRPRTYINFVAAKQRDMSQKAASKARKRSTELMNLIELDTTHFQLFDLPPVKEYDLYMSSFGRTNAQQAYVQTNDDDLERETQTEEIETQQKWCQHPPEGPVGCGGDAAGEENSLDKRVDEAKLSAFLQRSCLVIERLLLEEYGRSTYSEKNPDFSCSEALISLRNVELFASRPVSHCTFSPTQTNMLLTIHGKPIQAVDREVDKFGLIAVWNIHDPYQPQKILAGASIPTCCCFSPLKSTLVFAGMNDGSVVLWDLRESPTMHHSFMCGGKDWLLRFPTYNTAGVLQYDNHNSPVTSIQPILMDSKKVSLQDSGLGLSFQLASIDRNAVMNLWVVAEINDVSSTGSESDLGLSPNGKVKLLKSSHIRLTSPSKNEFEDTQLCALDMQLNPFDMNHFYVATDGGLVLHGARFGSQKVVPRAYMSDDSTPCSVNSLDIHPFGQPVFLAGCEDGSLRLHHLCLESPLIVWEQSTSGAPIKKVLWSRNCPYVIFVLDNQSAIHMWDLLRNDAEQMKTDKTFSTRVTDICLSDERDSNSKAKMALCFEDGSVQVHLLSSHVSILQPGEVDQFQRFVEQL